MLPHSTVYFSYQLEYLEFNSLQLQRLPYGLVPDKVPVVQHVIFPGPAADGLGDARVHVGTSTLECPFCSLRLLVGTLKPSNAVLTKVRKVVVRFKRLEVGRRDLLRQKASGVVAAMLERVVETGEVCASAKSAAWRSSVVVVVKFEEGRHFADFVLGLSTGNVR